MTDEEALLILKDEIKRIEYFKKECNSCIPDNVIEAYHIILKNIEVLDIAYKHRLNWYRLEMCENVKEFNLFYQAYPALKNRILTEDEFNKVKKYQMNKEKEKNENK